MVQFGDDLSVTLPLSRAHELLRAPVSEAGLCRVQETLRADAVLSDEAWPKRMQRAQERLGRGDPLGLAEIVRDSAGREQAMRTNGLRAKLSPSERALYLKARDLLSCEIGVVRGLGQKEADAWIDEQLALSAD